jgi:endonuclease/exonuclease/phosphatase family metal-dependent hydrolase
VLVVHHRGTYELDLESVRERQALATARFVEKLVEPSVPVVLLGDFNAAPDAASMRFLTGKQSLDGVSVRYEDAWAAVRPDEPGHTFTPRNPLVRAGQMPLERGRRIDYVLVRGGPHGPLLDVAECRLVGTEPVAGVWVSDHFGVLADLRRPAHPPGEWAALNASDRG